MNAEVSSFVMKFGTYFFEKRTAANIFTQNNRLI